ncbi:MAG: glycosyltransferase family 2 protein [Chitinophagales bacterium]
MNNHVKYSIVIPVLNEEVVVNETYQRLTTVMRSLGEPYELLFVNDGSTDTTAEVIKGFMWSDPSVRTLDFSRNFGHQVAISAGMDYALGDAIVIIDGDLQDPPELIPLMIEKWREGFEVVYARRSKREGETTFKKWTAAVFYRLLRSLTEIEIPLDTGDFRLIDRKVCDVLKGIREKNRFVRGLISWVGFRQTAIEYVRRERFAGETKYPFKKMLRLSLDGITSFSYKPLKLAAYLGVTVSIVSLVYMAVALGRQLAGSGAVSGVAWGIAGLGLLDGVILITLGILGEYAGRILDEVRGRPLYILRNQKESESLQSNEVTLEFEKQESEQTIPTILHRRVSKYIR